MSKMWYNINEETVQ